MQDPRFFTPMISTNADQVFVNDFIKVNNGGCLQIAKVKLFFRKVCARITDELCNYSQPYRKDVVIFS